MAFLTSRNRSGCKVWLVSYRADDGRQRSIYLGDVSKSQADDARSHINELLRAKKLGVDPKPRTSEWLGRVNGTLRTALIRNDLADAADIIRLDPELKKLRPFLDKCVNDMVDSKPRTRTNYRQTMDWLLRFFPDDQLVTDIRLGDMTRWQRFLRTKLGAVSNRNKHIQRAKRFFKTAVDDKLIDESPAAGLKFEASKKDKSRQYFIDRATTKRIMDALPDVHWRLLFALMRFQGMRRHEAVGLQWSHVDWDVKSFAFIRTRRVIESVPYFMRRCRI